MKKCLFIGAVNPEELDAFLDDPIKSIGIVLQQTRQPLPTKVDLDFYLDVAWPKAVAYLMAQIEGDAILPSDGSDISDADISDMSDGEDM